MAPVLKVPSKVLELLRIIWISRDCIKRFPGRGASLLAFLGRKLNTWCRFWLGIFGERRFIRSEASSYSVSGGSAVVREYDVVTASYVPASASHPSLHEHPLAESQPATVAPPVGVHPPVLAGDAVANPHTPNLVHPFGGRSFVNRSSDNLSIVSIQSCASDRYSIITNSRESIRATNGQPSRLPRATRRGPDSARSRERPTRPSTPTTPPPNAHPPHPHPSPRNYYCPIFYSWRWQSQSHPSAFGIFLSYTRAAEPSTYE
jgi:hypothetical protein